MKRKVLGFVIAVGLAVGLLMPMMAEPAMARTCYKTDGTAVTVSDYAGSCESNGFKTTKPASSGSGSSSAGGSCGKAFLGFKPWYDGLSCTDGKIDAPGKGADGTEVMQFVMKIVLVVLYDLLLAVGYIATAMVIYGGFMYIMSSGDPGKAMRGKKTLTSATIGMVIALSATVIVNTVSNVLASAPVKTSFNFAYSMAGVVAVGYIVKSGVEYMMSVGDPGKAQKARRGIIYAAVGLVVVMLAAALTNLVTGTTTDVIENEGTWLNSQVIEKRGAADE